MCWPSPARITQEVMDAVHQHLPKPHDPFIDLVPAPSAGRHQAHAQALRLSEDQRGLQPPLHLLHHPVDAWRPGVAPVGDVLKEARALFAGGVKELLVVSQDTSAYGVDVKYRTGFLGRQAGAHALLELVQQLGEIRQGPGAWVRLHYVYPYPSVDEIIPLMADGLVLPYLDVPFQHSHLMS